MGFGHGISHHPSLNYHVSNALAISQGSNSVFTVIAFLQILLIQKGYSTSDLNLPFMRVVSDCSSSIMNPSFRQGGIGLLFLYSINLGTQKPNS